MKTIGIHSNSITLHGYDKHTDKTKIYLQAAEKYGTNLFADVPICDEFLLLIEQMFTREEAAVIRHLNTFPKGKTADIIAKAEHRPVGEIQEILENLSHTKRAIMSFGPKNKKRYAV